MISARRLWLLTLLLLLSAACARVPQTVPQPTVGTVRSAFYNIEWFSEDANPTRIRNIKSVLDNIKPNVVGLCEVQSRRALSQIFDGSWEIGMGDFPEAYQELAIAVRRPYKLESFEFIFKDPTLDYAWPRTGRDCLKAVVLTPEGQRVTFYVVHMKSRGGGRLPTDDQRVMAAGLLASYIRGQKDKNYVVMGDMNDAPNDRSVNVLVSGNLFAEGGAYAQPKLLHNLMNPLHDQDYVTYGMEELHIDEPIKAIVAGAKEDNDRLRGKEYRFPDDVKVPQILFDQILVSPEIFARGVPVVRIYDGEDAMRGLGGRIQIVNDVVNYLEKGTLASDHLPVFADIRLN